MNRAIFALILGSAALACRDLAFERRLDPFGAFAQQGLDKGNFRSDLSYLVTTAEDDPIVSVQISEIEGCTLTGRDGWTATGAELTGPPALVVRWTMDCPHIRDPVLRIRDRAGRDVTMLPLF